LRCPNVRFVVKVYYTNNVIAGAYQGYGAPQGSFAMQTALAELAEVLGMDHLALLEKNHVRKGDILEILKCLGEGQEGIPQPVSSCGLPECLEEGARLCRWGRREESADPDVKIGKGVAIIQQGSGLPGIDSANASIQMMGDGTFMILMGGTDLGTGLDTLAVKVAAEILRVDPESISIISSDTDVTPFDVGAYASSGTYFSGMAVHKAAEAMRERIIGAAAHVLKEPASGISLEYPGRAVGKSGEVSYGEIAHETQCGEGCGQLIAHGNFTTDKSPIPYGAHFAKVAVNTRTGKVNVLAYYALQDCGTPINPDLALGQIYGGVIKSMGHTLWEEMKFDGEGRCLNPNFLDYKVPMINDLPDEFLSKIIYVQEALGPFGAKSVSEISTNGAAPAIASAIHDAVGVWMRSWPFTPEKVLEAMEMSQNVRQENAAP
jgi:putative selenate reductase molybdopterin-binding subunit